MDLKYYAEQAKLKHKEHKSFWILLKRNRLRIWIMLYRKLMMRFSRKLIVCNVPIAVKQRDHYLLKKI